MLRMLCLAVAVTHLAAAGASAQAAGLVVKESTASHAATVQRVEAEIEKRGAKVVATVDHAAAAKSSGLEMRPTTVVIFGNPKLGTPLMRSSQTAGIDLPLRVLVWEDADGKVRVGYWKPTRLAEDHGIGGHDEVIRTMGSALEAIASAAATP